MFAGYCDCYSAVGELKGLRKRTGKLAAIYNQAKAAMGGEWLYECKTRDCHEHQPHEVHKCLMYFVKYAEKGFPNGEQRGGVFGQRGICAICTVN